MSRERQVVHSEYTSKFKSDGRRAMYARKQAMNPEHPYARFAVGNNETLADRDDSAIRDELIRFYEDHYSANIMALAVLGREPLEQLREWVVERFSAIPNSGRTRLEVDVPIFRSEQLPARIDIVPIKDRRSLSLSFPIPPVDSHFRSKPTLYISHLIGHEGKGSLLSLLKEKGWADGLSAGLGLNHPDDATLGISIDLTAEGLAHVEDVVTYVFRYIDLMRSSGVARWTFEEQRKLSQLRFLYAEKSEPIGLVRALANDLHELPPDELLRGRYLLEEFDPALIQEYLGYLRPENMLMTVTATGLETDSRTDWFDVDYQIRPIGGDMLARWRSPPPDPSLTLPGPNRFVPDDLTMEPGAAPDSVPVALERRPGFELWHRQDTEFGLPLASFYFSVRSPVANDSPRHALLTSLYVALVNDHLTEFSYDADLAGLSYDLYKHIRGFTVRVSGYDDKQPVLVERIVDALRNPQIADDRFEVAKENMIRGLRNAQKNSPYRRGIDEVRLLLTEPDWSEEQLLEVIADIGAEDVRRFVPELLSRVHVVALAHGNVNRDEALTLARVVEQGIVEPAAHTSVPSGRVVKLARGDSYVRDIDNAQDDSAAVVYYQGPDKLISSRARVALLVKMMAPAFFEELRTEKQLGYIVFATNMTILETPGVALIVQSPIADPIALQEHVDAFLQNFAKVVANLDRDTFERHRTALINELMEADSTLEDRTDRYWTELDREYYAFDLREKLAAAIEAISLEDFKESYQRILLGDGRRRLAVRAQGRQHTVAAQVPGGGGQATVIRHAPSFKQTKGFFSG